MKKIVEKRTEFISISQLKDKVFQKGVSLGLTQKQLRIFGLLPEQKGPDIMITRFKRLSWGDHVVVLLLCVHVIILLLGIMININLKLRAVLSRCLYNSTIAV